MALPKRQQREQFKTYKGVFDDHTERVLFKLHSEGHFDHLAEPVSIGKEANIFTAVRKTSEGERKVIVKVYRVENCDFSKMYQYIRQDARFLNLKKKRRLIIFMWAKREYRNLLKARDAGCRVPTPLANREHIIVMELVGDEEPALKLTRAPPENPRAFYEEVVENMRKLFKAGLVHGDLSPFNILNHQERPVFIDFSQATVVESANAEELLERDIRNIQGYFVKQGLHVNKEDMMKKIIKKEKG